MKIIINIFILTALSYVLSAGQSSPLTGGEGGEGGDGCHHYQSCRYEAVQPVGPQLVSVVGGVMRLWSLPSPVPATLTVNTSMTAARITQPPASLRKESERSEKHQQSHSYHSGHHCLPQRQSSLFQMCW